jgi:hypothetical protein
MARPVQMRPVMTQRGPICVLLVVATLGAACSTYGRGAGLGADAQADATDACAAAVAGDELSCRGDLTTAGCPPDWGSVDKTTVCSSCRYYVGPVGGFLTKFVNCNPVGNGGGSSCYYDAATGDLAGAVVITDTTTLCCGKSALQLSGAVTRELFLETDALAVMACQVGQDASPR